MTLVDGEERSDVVRENLAFLTEAGVTDRDVLADRLGFTNRVAMERFFFRNNIRIRREMGTTYRDVHSDGYLYAPESSIGNPPEEREAAMRCILRQTRNLGALDEADELIHMLGLGPELVAATRRVKELAS